MVSIHNSQLESVVPLLIMACHNGSFPKSRPRDAYIRIGEDEDDMPANGTFHMRVPLLSRILFVDQVTAYIRLMLLANTSVKCRMFDMPDENTDAFVDRLVAWSNRRRNRRGLPTVPHHIPTYVSAITVPWGDMVEFYGGKYAMEFPHVLGMVMKASEAAAKVSAKHPIQSFWILGFKRVETPIAVMIAIQISIATPMAEGADSPRCHPIYTLGMGAAADKLAEEYYRKAMEGWNCVHSTTGPEPDSPESDSERNE